MAGQPIGFEGFIVVVDSHDALPPARMLVAACEEAPHRLRNVKILAVDPSGQSSVFPDH